MEEFAVENLPTRREVLRHAATLLFEKRKKKAECLLGTARKVHQIWEEHELDPQLLYRVRDKIKTLLDEYIEMKKRRKRSGVLLKLKREKYIKDLDCIFDISKSVQGEACDRNRESPESDVPNESSLPEITREVVNRRALHQIAGSSNAQIDCVMENVGENSNVLRNPSTLAVNKSNQNNKEVLNKRATVELDESFCDSSVRLLRKRKPHHSDPEDNDNVLLKAKPNKNTCLIMDRIGLSNESGSLLFLAIADQFGYKENEVTCSTSTVFRLRKQHREEESGIIKEKFDSTDMKVVHWDGKTYSMRGNRKDKRLAVALSNAREAKMLDVVEILDGCGKTCADSVYSVLNNWGLIKHIVAMSFDTENVNSGKDNRASLLLEEKINRPLLHLACRHHILEIILGAVFKNSIEENRTTDGPKIPFFEKFCGNYYNTQFNKQLFRGCENDEYFGLLNDGEKTDLLEFCEKTLMEKLPRNDYRELLKLTVILLSPPNAIVYRIQAPGAYNRARFMCRIIYSLKIYLYRDQLHLLPEEITAVKQVVLFVLKVYLKSWFQATNAIKSSNNDLIMLKTINSLVETMPNIATAALGKLHRHLWYLSEKTVAFGLFDVNVSVDTKVQMVRKLKSVRSCTNERVHKINQRNINRPRICPNIDISNISLPDFVSKRTMMFFDILKLNTDFLKIHPRLWENNESFLLARETVKKLTVINDASERSIALYQNYMDNVKTNDQKQYLLQVAEKGRKRFKRLRKQEICQALQESM